MTNDGILLITARRHRTQLKNRDEALERLVELVRKAAVAPKKRRKTKPTVVSKERRLEGKRRKSKVKRMRKRVATADQGPQPCARTAPAGDFLSTWQSWHRRGVGT